MRVFGIDYQFLSCGSVFIDGLVHAAADLGVEYTHALWHDVTVDQVAAFDPDLLFVVHGRRFGQRFLDLSVFGVPTAVWLLDEPYEVDETSRWSSRFDYVFINDPATLDRHERASYLPVCYDPHVHNFPNETHTSGQRPHAVGFIGGGNGTRDRYLGALARAGLLTYVVGGEWSDPQVRQRCLSGNIAPSQTAALYRQTRIILNVFREEHHFNVRGTAATSLNPRVYEASACGALVVSEWRPEVDVLVPELPTFRTEAECVELVAHLLAHPDEAEAIRRACEPRIAPHHYQKRLFDVLKATGVCAPAEIPTYIIEEGI